MILFWLAGWLFTLAFCDEKESFFRDLKFFFVWPVELALEIRRQIK